MNTPLSTHSIDPSSNTNELAVRLGRIKLAGFYDSRDSFKQRTRTLVLVEVENGKYKLHPYSEYTTTLSVYGIVFVRVHCSRCVAVYERYINSRVFYDRGDSYGISTMTAFLKHEKVDSSPRKFTVSNEIYIIYANTATFSTIEVLVCGNFRVAKRNYKIAVEIFPLRVVYEVSIGNLIG